MRLSQIPWTKIIAALVAAALMIVVVGTVRGGAPTAPNAKDVKHADRVLAGKKTPEGGARRVGGNGIVEPAGREAKLASQAHGVVRSLEVTEGAYVAEGAVLIELEATEQQAALAAAQLAK